MNPKELCAGEIWDDGKKYIFSLHFIERVTATGVYVELLHTPGRWPATRLHGPSTTYSKHLGHGCFLPFSSSFWRNTENWTKHGSIPALIGNKSIKLPA